MSEFYRQAEGFLASLDPQWAAHIQAIGPCQHQPHPQRDPYQALVRAIAYQQLHVKAGDAILGRFLALYPDCGFPSPAQVLATTPEQLRACGFSASKLATIQGIARAREEGLVPDHDQALALDDEQLIERLVSLRGVGRWTVEMLLIFRLGRPDVLPVDDLGVRKGFQRAYGMRRLPAAVTVVRRAERWRPYRSVASWYLWREAERR